MVSFIIKDINLFDRCATPSHQIYLKRLLRCQSSVICGVVDDGGWYLILKSLAKSRKIMS